MSDSDEQQPNQSVESLLKYSEVRVEFYLRKIKVLDQAIKTTEDSKGLQERKLKYQ